MNKNGKAPLGVFVTASTCVGGNCVEVAALPGGLIGIRDSKNAAASAPVLRFDRAEWEAFLEGVAAGEFTYATLTTGALMASV
jgi:hypothetical protein